MKRIVLGLVAVVGCGGTHASAEAQLELGGGSIGLGGFMFQGTRVGATSEISFTLTNSGTVDTGLIVAEVTGDTAFTVDPASDCVGATLSPAATCTVSAMFSPTMVGTHAGTLDVTASPGGLVSLEVSGAGDDLGIVFDPTTIDFGAVSVGPYSQVVHVSNSGTDPIAISSITVNGPVFSDTTTCGDSIPGGGTCDVTVAMNATSLGMQSATLTVASAAQLVSAPITGVVGGTVTVIKAGEGTGTVSSDVGGIVCGASCSAIFAAAIQLTATADAGSVFLGWSDPSCGASPTCAVTADVVAQSFTATFASASTSTLTVQFAGNATGQVLGQVTHGVDTTNYTCAATCALPVASGDNVLLTALSPSDVVGWTGACVSSVPDCTLTITGDATASATFAKATSETWTRVFLPGEIVRSVAADSMNRFVLGTSAGLVALDAAGATRWSVATLPDPNHPMMTVAAAGRAYLDGHDNVFVVAANVLAKLDSSGNVTWTIDLGANADSDQNRMAHQLATSPNGDVAVQVGTTVRVYTTDGTLHWMADLFATATANSVAIDPAGNVNVLADSEDGETQTVERFDPTGAPLTVPAISVAGEYRASLAFDSTASYVTSSSGHSDVYVERVTSASSMAFDEPTTVSDPDFVENGVAVDSGDHIYSVYHGPDQELDADGFIAHRHSSTGTVTWSFTRPTLVTAMGLGVAGTDVRDLATDHAGNVAFVGRYVLPDGTWSAIIQVFEP